MPNAGRYRRTRRHPANLDDPHRQVAQLHPPHLLGEIEQPSVECPVGDFFACGWGQYAQVSSLAVCVNPGSAFNCYWEMPFRKRCRMTMTTSADEQMTLYYQVNYTLTEVPEDAAYFHAQFRRFNPLPYKEVYTILDGVRAGHTWAPTWPGESNNTGWWGEGEIKFYLDGDKEYPTICGTGTEDYFCGSYNFETRPDGNAVPASSPRPMPACPGHPPGRAVPVADALRPVPLAHHGPGALRDRTWGDDPGAGLARRALPAAAG